MAELAVSESSTRMRVFTRHGRRDRAAASPGIGYRLALVWLGIVTAVSLGASLLPIQDPLEPDFRALNASPSAAHWLGTDALGRDIFARIVHGSQVTLVVGVAATALSLLLGLLLGLVAGYFRGWVDVVITWLVDVFLAFPALVLALVLAAFLGPSLRNVIVAIGVIAFPGFVRLARAATLQVASREYVLVARSLGARHRRVIVSEILPNVLQPMMTFAITVVGLVIIVEGGLSFLGLGVPLPHPTWGGMINEGRSAIDRNPAAVLAPTAVLLATILALNSVGERLSRRYGLGEVRS